MKTRLSFISNSSSSSFIATIAVVRDDIVKEVWRKAWCRLDRYNYEEICKRYGRGEISLIISQKPMKNTRMRYLFMSILKQDFYPEDGEDECEPDYDSVSIDDFSEKDQQLFSATLEDGLEIMIKHIMAEETDEHLFFF